MEDQPPAVESPHSAGTVTQRDCARWGALLFLGSAAVCAALYFSMVWLNRDDWLENQLRLAKFYKQVLRSVLTALLPAAAFGAGAGVLLFRNRTHGGKAHTWVAAAFALPVAVAFVDGFGDSHSPLCLLGLALFAAVFLLYWINLGLNNATTANCITVAVVLALLFACYIGAKGTGGLHDKIAGAIYGSMWLGDALLARKVFGWSRAGRLAPPKSNVIQFSLGTMMLAILGACFYVWLVMTMFSP